MIPLDRHDDTNLRLYFRPAVCSLADLHAKLISGKKKFSPNDILYIFKQCIGLILLLKEKGYTHSSICTSDIVVVQEQNQQGEPEFQVRLVDLGDANNKLQK